MDSQKEYQKRIGQLREKALSRLAKSSRDIPESVAKETREVLQDLHVHQIELEMQNEELRQVHRDLERSRDHYLSLYHGAPVGYVVANSAGMVLQANKTFADMIDRDIAALLNKPLSQYIHVDDRSVFLARYKAFYKNPANKRLEVRMVRYDQSGMNVKLEGHRFNADGDGLSDGTLAGQLLISISDITERKTAETAIIRAKVQWEQTFDAVPDLVAIMDEQSTVVRVNKALSRRLGVEPKDCIGKKCYEVLHEDRPHPSECPHQQFYRTGKPSESEAYNRKLNGHFITTVLPFDPGDAENHWCIHISRDVTDRKRAEKELLKLRNLESIGKLAGGMAHDFNNILTAVIGHVDLAILHVGNREKQISHLHSAVESAYRAQALANRLITFAEGGNQMKQAVNLAQLLEETTMLTLSGSNVVHELDLASDLPALIADKEQIKSAIQNILINAKEAMPQGGKLSLKVREADLDRFNGQLVRRGRYAKITIRDEGCGIAADDLGKIFDPYFSTKQLGDQKGMGLGLAISHSIVTKHKGQIDVRSEEGTGTTVTILLPMF